MTRAIMYEIAKQLRSLAREIDETALGSSRVEMYRVLAQGVREQASRIELLTPEDDTP